MLHELLNATRQADDLRPLVLDEILRVRELVAERLNLGCDSFRGIRGRKVEGGCDGWIGHEELNFVGELQAIDELALLAAAGAFVEEFARFCDSPRGEEGQPCFVRPVAADALGQFHFENRDDAEEPHTHGRLLNIGTSDETTRLAVPGDEAAVMAGEGLDGIGQGSGGLE